MSAQIIPLVAPPAPPTPVVRCSFCERPVGGSRIIIANGHGTHHICSDCVAKAKERIQETAEAPQ